MGCGRPFLSRSGWRPIAVNQPEARGGRRRRVTEGTRISGRRTRNGPILPFEGFTPVGLEFLRALRVNNNRRWFEAHKLEFRENMIEPLRRLVAELGPLMRAIDERLEVEPAVGKTISRVNRNTRFSADKRPYRDRMWLILRRPSRNWMDAPDYFFEVWPEGYRYGMGFYRASRQTMDALRARVQASPPAFLAALARSRRAGLFVVEGERYRRPPAIDAPDFLMDWCVRRNVYLVCNRRPDAELYSAELATSLARRFQEVAPVYHYLLSSRVGAGGPSPPPRR